MSNRSLYLDPPCKSFLESLHFSSSFLNFGYEKSTLSDAFVIYEIWA